MKVVIADDSDLFRERLKDVLNKISTVEIVAEATNGIDALNQVMENDPDLLILDIRMPELGGISVLQKIKEGEFKCKIIVFTNFPYQQYKDKCLAEGADYFMYKNNDFQLMLETVNQLASESTKY